MWFIEFKQKHNLVRWDEKRLPSRVFWGCGYFKRGNTLIKTSCYSRKPHPMNRECLVVDMLAIKYDSSDVPTDTDGTPWTEQYINEANFYHFDTIERLFNLFINYGFTLYIH